MSAGNGLIMEAGTLPCQSVPLSASVARCSPPLLVEPFVIFFSEGLGSLGRASEVGGSWLTGLGAAGVFCDPTPGEV